MRFIGVPREPPPALITTALESLAPTLAVRRRTEAFVRSCFRRSAGVDRWRAAAVAGPLAASATRSRQIGCCRPLAVSPRAGSALTPEEPRAAHAAHGLLPSTLDDECRRLLRRPTARRPSTTAGPERRRKEAPSDALVPWLFAGAPGRRRRTAHAPRRRCSPASPAAVGAVVGRGGRKACRDRGRVGCGCRLPCLRVARADEGTFARPAEDHRGDRPPRMRSDEWHDG